MNPSLIKISFFILLVSFACKVPQEDVSATITYPEQPNIVWIVAEDLSPQHLGIYGGTGGKTPFLDSLAADGVIYSHAYSTAGVCAPSRAALITGAYQTAVGGHNMRTLGMSQNALDAYPPGHKSYSAVIPADMKTYPELLRMAGYYTSNNSKEDYQFKGPVTMWDESSNKAHWRNRKDSNQPFFSIFNLNISHESQVWARADEPLLVDPADVFIPPYYPDDSISRAVMARFITNAMRMDMQAGEIIQQLKDDGLYENTIIFFYGDHGDGMPYAKRELYDRGLKVPLIIKAPFFEKGGQLDELVSFVDFAPTVLSLAGVEVPKSMQGQAFLGVQKADPRKYIYAARDRMDSEYDRVRAVSDGRFKYIRNYMPEKPNYQNIQYRLNNPLMIYLLELNKAGKLDANQSRWFAPNKPTEELYDTSVDPYEFNNLVADPEYAEKLTELRAAHEQWLLDYPDLGAMNEQEMVRNWWGGKDTPPITAAPEIAFNVGKVSINVDMPGASIGYRKSTNDTWSVYVGPFEAVRGDSLYVNVHRIGYEPNGGAMVLK
ncbi:MAG: sulfatase-like hydrolase/transferase [Algoriphagus sp.]|uniref:sulfatase-like hydrolase/transferase n=1 Tax=Algoriphagus sp. TaxID=1872435 RepID=UPI002601CABE|nr:sulfatase-like hydrolase/transferase [Algoriphagus sp.]MDG1279019.1 sulfatase-like hydrolase/transferase [Algoriphagus sp.]